MAFLVVPHVSIDGIAACVPATKGGYPDINHLFTEEEYKQFQQLTGIYSARKPDPGVCTSDLCFTAADRLLREMGVDRKEIDLVIFVSQTPDYIIPMTACLLQERLGLSTDCICFDTTVGCSGYIYGLSMAASFLSGKGIKRGLLLAGDCSLTQNSRLDKSTYPLFGAAGTATLLSFNEHSEGFKFQLGTDGSGADAIMIKAGGQRHPVTPESFIMKEIEPGIIRSDNHLILNGMDVFTFAISEAPNSVERLYQQFDLKKEETDYFVFHQANKMILDVIADDLELPEGKELRSIGEFANTSSASIPLTLVTKLGTVNQETTLCLCGFGVGLSWGSCYFKVSDLYCSPLIEYV